MLTLRVDGRDLALEETRWSAYEATRRGRLLQAGGQALTVTSELRMAWNDTAVLWTLTLENVAKNGTGAKQQGPARATASSPPAQRRQHALEFSVQMQARALERMGWLVFDAPQNLSEFRTRVVGPPLAAAAAGGTAGEAGQQQRSMVLHEDTLSDAASGFAFVDQQPAEWAWMLNSGNPNGSAAVGTVERAAGALVLQQTERAVDVAADLGGFGVGDEAAHDHPALEAPRSRKRRVVEFGRRNVRHVDIGAENVLRGRRPVRTALRVELLPCDVAGLQRSNLLLSRGRGGRRRGTSAQLVKQHALVLLRVSLR